MIFDRHENLKYKYRNRQFWCKGYYVNTAEGNKKVIEEYIKNQIQEDQTDEVRRYSEKGTFYPNATINFSNAPYVDSSNIVIDTYTIGESVIYDIVVIGNR